MQGAKQYHLKIREEEYFDLPLHLRERASVFYNDYELYKNDPKFIGLISNYRRAKTELEKYKFEQRHKI